MEDLFGTIYEFLATEEKYLLITACSQLKFLKQYTFDNNIIDLLIKKNDKVIIKKIICNGLKIESSHAIIYWAIERDYLNIIKILENDVIELSKKYQLQCKAVEYNSINIFNQRISQSQKNHILA